MRVGILAPEFIPSLGGAGIYVVNLVKELCKDKTLEIHVITPKRGTNYDKNKVLKHFNNKIYIHNISIAKDSFVYNFGFQLQIFRMLPKLQKKCHFDLIHTTGLVHMPDIFQKLRKQKIPSLVTVHTTIDSQFDYKPALKEFLKNTQPVEVLSKFIYPYIKLMQNKYIKKTKNYICVSNYVSRYIPNSKNTVIIKNGVDTKKFKPGKNNQFLFLDQVQKPKILFCGRLLYMKGVDTLISAAKEVLKNHDVHFVFAGSGRIKQTLPKEDFSLIGYIKPDEMPFLYQKADVFVLPSFVESFPYTLLEAMSSGLPVITTKVGGIPELVEHNKTGLLVEPNNVNQLIIAIEYLILNPAKRERIGRNAREHILSNYTIEKMASKTRNFYKKIVGDFSV